MSITVTIDNTTKTSQSVFSPGLTHVDNTLNYPFGSNDLTAVNSAKSLLPAFPFQNSHIMEWGIDDPWSDPAQTEPSVWGFQDTRIAAINAAGATPVMTLCEAPWWMKGHLNSDGTTSLVPDVNGENFVHTYAGGLTDYRGLVYAPGYVSPDPYACRILDNQFTNWLHLVQRVCERYMVAPYNVRYFQVWNELKGYYNAATNNYDYTTGAGDSSGYNAKHGYTYLYNQTYTQLMTTATALGIDPSSIKIGGPYVHIDTWSVSSAGGFPTSETALTGKTYGYYDDRPVQVIKYWFQNKTGAGFVTIDGGNTNKDSDITDEFTASQKLGDIVTWIRSLNNTTYPGAATLPVWWAEWYTSPYSGAINDNWNAAIKAYAISYLLKAGGATAIEWGSQGAGSTLDSGLWTNTTVGGGQARTWYYAYKAFSTYFPPGTHLYSFTNSDPASLEVLPGSPFFMLINKTNSVASGTVNGQTFALSPYQVRVLSPTTASFSAFMAHI